MGIVFSIIKFALGTLQELANAYGVVAKRIGASPGIPVPSPSQPFWAVPSSPLSRHGSEHSLPVDTVDVVVIGSGIAGTSFARELLRSADVEPPRVVMLDARDACYGATARNGGHISPLLYHEFDDLEKTFGIDMAKNIIHFRRAHLSSLLEAANEEGLLESSQARKVDTYDVFFEETLYKDMHSKLERYLDVFPGERGAWSTDGGPDSGMKLQLDERVCGTIKTCGGAIHPYRLVSGILSNLLKEFDTRFSLFTHTPCIDIIVERDVYVVQTPRGAIRAKNIVHATNGWTSNLLAPMRRKIIPVRGHMSAQRPGQGLSVARVDGFQSMPNWQGTRSFVFYPGTTQERFDYLTQQPNLSQSSSLLGRPPRGEMMFGGGMQMGSPSFMDAIGATDDSVTRFPDRVYLGGALPEYFGRHWGAEGRGEEEEDCQLGRMKMVWSGILGISADRMPWVGRLPAKLSGRGEVKNGGEWIVAGFTGEGMAHAWLSGKALAQMLRAGNGDAPDGFPRVFLPSESRWKKANIENML
ncbi:FAD dependent oxidoreductase [Cylindrobasidium torrendii FP15055 ss-10]|uniref:FAD dependent oxidoreductase n=1 Tax=Cylindrobasidium torrendii FP15055 ss-10 TaxID=1314674 RepID=A0A0D7AYW2_9AGAR|nr:FAD dependent oxidoreductase [Cylindrobasidium torrendii FP15055 ss-10]